MLTLSTAFLATSFGVLLFSKAFHLFVKSFGAQLFFIGSAATQDDTMQQQYASQWTDHLVNILIHSFHVVWVSIFSLAAASLHYNSGTESYITAFPFLFLSSFYMHELSVRHMSTDVLLHHLLFPALFLYALQDGKTRLVDLYAALEIGHVFHFLPYLLYKRGNSLETVLIAVKIGTVLFFLIRVLGVIGVTIFILACTSEYQDSTLFVQIFLGICVSAMVILQVYFWWDLVTNQRVILSKIKNKHNGQLSSATMSASEDTEAQL